MNAALSLESLLALRDEDVRRNIYNTFVDQLLATSPLALLNPDRDGAPLFPLDPEWTGEIARAALVEFLTTSIVGWVRESDAYPTPDLLHLLAPENPVHRQTADRLYLSASPSCLNDGVQTLMSYLADDEPWGERLADWAHSSSATAYFSGLSSDARRKRLTSLFAKLHWLAPNRVDDVRLALELRADEAAFFFEAEILRNTLFPHLVIAISRRLVEGSLTHLEGFTLASSLAGESSLIEPEEAVTHLTADLLDQRVRELPPLERRMLTDALLRALPLLRKAIGEFIEPTLRRLAEEAE